MIRVMIHLKQNDYSFFQHTVYLGKRKRVVCLFNILMTSQRLAANFVRFRRSVDQDRKQELAFVTIDKPTGSTTR